MFSIKYINPSPSSTDSTQMQKSPIQECLPAILRLKKITILTTKKSDVNGPLNTAITQRLIDINNGKIMIQL